MPSAEDGEVPRIHGQHLNILFIGSIGEDFFFEGTDMSSSFQLSGRESLCTSIGDRSRVTLKLPEEDWQKEYYFITKLKF
jgi:hypothetical protein